MFCGQLWSNATGLTCLTDVAMTHGFSEKMRNTEALRSYNTTSPCHEGDCHRSPASQSLQ